MTYAVKLDAYEGPLDLLLQLISKERINVADINIAGVTDEFLRLMAELGDVDLETASSFLILAATLLELKSFKLLPDRNQNDPAIKLLLEERDRLLHRLIVYSSFKEAAAALGSLIARNIDFHSRVAELPEELLPQAPDIFRDLTPQMLAGAAARALSPPDVPSVDTSHLTPITVSLAEMVDRLRAQIEHAGFSSFRDLCRTATHRMHVVVSLLAVLELFRTELIEIDQSEPFADISVSWLSRS